MIRGSIDGSLGACMYTDIHLLVRRDALTHAPLGLGEDRFIVLRRLRWLRAVDAGRSGSASGVVSRCCC